MFFISGFTNFKSLSVDDDVTKIDKLIAKNINEIDIGNLLNKTLRLDGEYFLELSWTLLACKAKIIFQICQ